MQKSVLTAALIFAATTTQAQFATSVVSFNAGVGYQVEFGSNIPITDPSQALGAPTASNPGEFGGPVDPFNPPYLASQIVSMGTGGSLTLRFDTPIENHAANPFGLDFIVFGNAGFIITNGDFGGGGITDGSLFGAAEPNSTRVSISADNNTYFTLSPLLTPTFDRYFPTDSQGNPHIAVNPAFANEPAFLNQGLPGIRQRYNGSAGGTGFDIDWARDLDNNPVNLSSIQYIRVEVLSGSAEIDSISVVPEPTTSALLTLSALLLLRKRK